MKVLKRVSSIRRHLEAHRKKSLTVGFIPTMGALHKGHMSLVDSSRQENDVTVVSIFVNPTQFNQKEDLIKYPRNIERDMKFLHKAGVEYLFAPPVIEVYPKDLDTKVYLDISKFTARMEGPHRPGHFEGVLQVVHRFLNILSPDRIYMGQKDFQQFSVIHYMLEKFSINTRLVVCPTVRMSNGLAMSSRNERLTDEIRGKAGIIYNNLKYTRDHLEEISIEKLEQKALKNLSTGPFRPEYFEIFDGFSFDRVKNPEEHDMIVAGTAVWAGDVRLIDNMILKGRERLYKD